MDERERRKMPPGQPSRIEVVSTTDPDPASSRIFETGGSAEDEASIRPWTPMDRPKTMRRLLSGPGDPFTAQLAVLEELLAEVERGVEQAAARAATTVHAESEFRRLLAEHGRACIRLARGPGWGERVAWWWRRVVEKLMEVEA